MTGRIPENLRINADDFGLSPAISRAILQAARAGLINSFSVVPFADEENGRLLEAAARLPGMRVGAHLSFIEVPLLTRPPGFPEGAPPANHRAFVKAWLRGRVTAAVVRSEWAAQLDWLQNRLADPQAIHHLDSHQHVHLLPGLWAVARDLQRARGIPRLRCPAETSLRAWGKDFPLGAGLQILSFPRRRREQERFWGVGTSMAFRAEAHQELARQIRAFPERCFELMVHPGGDSRGQQELAELDRWLKQL